MSLMGIVYSSRKPDFVFFSWKKWRDWVLGQLEPYFTTKKTLGKAMKCSAALALVIDITNNALPSCQVTHGHRLLFPKTRLSALSMAKMVKLGFWPT